MSYKSLVINPQWHNATCSHNSFNPKLYGIRWRCLGNSDIELTVNGDELMIYTRTFKADSVCYEVRLLPSPLLDKIGVFAESRKGGG